MSVQQFMELLFGKLPDFFQGTEELRKLWSAPDTRAKLLAALAEKDIGHAYWSVLLMPIAKTLGRYVDGSCGSRE